jgi:glucose/arabinose dehydrogenase
MKINVVITLLVSVLLLNSLWASDLPEGFVEEEIATGLNPVSITRGPDNIIYIAEKNGKIKVAQNDVLLPTPLLDLEVNDFNERGLISIALHPDYFDNGYYYVYYCPKNGNKNRVARFTATNTGRSTLPGSEVLIIELDALVGGIHNGGCLKFGTDGKLYIATGDGGVATNSKLLSNMLGKVLRINEDGSIPADNPFYNDTNVTGINKSIYAYGLRNPFAFDFDANGVLYATDVGEGAAEEVNKILPGKFYGWPDREGNSGSTDIANYQAPEYFYPHTNGSCAIIGCTFYNPINKTFPAEYSGKMFFGDYCNEKIYTWDPVTKERKDFATGANRPLSYLVSDNGDLYYVERNGSAGGSVDANTVSYDGKLWKIRYTNSNEVFINRNPQNASHTVGENAIFTVNAYSKLQPLTYQWFRNGTLLEGANKDTLRVNSVSLSDNNAKFHCVVSNSISSDTSTEALLSVVQNTRPVPTITSPVINSFYSANDQLTISGSATDAEDGILSGSSLTFWMDLHHDTHTHPALAPTDGSNLPISFTIPNNGETSPNVFFRVYLRATDSDGFSSTTHVDIYPNLVGITVNSNVPEAEINFDGTYYPVGEKVYSVKGLIRILAAPTIVTTDTKTCYFKEWSNGNATKLIVFPTPAKDLELIATFDCDDAKYSGNGLLGTYSDVESITNQAEGSTLNGITQKYTQIDETINFNWYSGSPNVNLLGDDLYTITWKGYIRPPLDADYTFTIDADDGFTLIIDNDIVINQWKNGVYNNVEATIYLEGKTFYPIELRYFESSGHAHIKMMWASSILSKDFIDPKYLYTDLPTFTSVKTDFKNSANKLLLAKDGAKIKIISHTEMIESFEIYNITGNKIVNGKAEIQHQWIDMSKYPEGLYIIHLIDNGEPSTLKFIR